MSSPRCLRPVSHVIFDLDGLLLNTEHIYTRVTSGMLKEYGHSYSYKLKASLMGKGPLEVAAAIVGHYSLPLSPEEWSAKTRTEVARVLPQCEFLPGATKLLHHLYKVRWYMYCIRTSATILLTAYVVNIQFVQFKKGSIAYILVSLFYYFLSILE